MLNGIGFRENSHMLLRMRNLVEGSTLARKLPMGRVTNWRNIIETKNGSVQYLKKEYIPSEDFLKFASGKVDFNHQ
ncbi:hypothetical protein SLA2020_207850 [Shorea laevis]